jgi:hypothetical protein
MLNAFRPQDDIDGATEDLLGPVQRRTGRQLNDIDEVALILLGDEAGRRLCEFDAGNADQPGINHEHDGHGAYQPARHVSVAEGEPLESPIEAIESAV